MKHSLVLLLTALSFALAGAVYAQSRDRSRGYDRSFDRGSDRFSRGSSGFTSPAAATAPFPTSAPATAPMAARPVYEAPSPGRSLPGEYGLLSRKSIFSRDRRSYVQGPRPEPDTRLVETRPAPPPAIPVLVGVLIGDDDLIAYIEDPDSGKLWPLAAGDPLPGTYGSVRSVSLDDITIAAENGPERRILIGQNLAGESASSHTLTSSFSPSSGAATSPGSTTGPALDPNDPNLTIEQKMKLRRMQQVGK